MSEDATSMLGSVVSSMVKVAVVVLVLPQSSVAVKVTVSAPVAPQRSLNPVELLLQVTLPQLSEAAAPAMLANQALKRQCCLRHRTPLSHRMPPYQ